MFQMGGIGPMFGQVGFFHKWAGKAWEDKRPRDRYVAEAKRLLDVLERRLVGRDWLMGDAYTIADIATFPWVNNLVTFYEAGELVGFADFPNVGRVLQGVPRAAGGRARAEHSGAAEAGLTARAERAALERAAPPRRYFVFAGSLTAFCTSNSTL